jgi:hypothetical protein
MKFQVFLLAQVFAQKVIHPVKDRYTKEYFPRKRRKGAKKNP